MKKRKHHIVPRCYLKNFAAEDENIWTYRLDSPDKPFSKNYEKVGHIRDYYAQPGPDGTTEHNLLEDSFNKLVETKWAGLVGLMANKEYLSTEQVGDIFNFIALQRVRVPATRDMVEIGLAHRVKLQITHLKKQGELPPPPSSLCKDGEIHWDKIDITIDPHQSIHAMVNLIKDIGIILDLMGYAVLHNKTDLPFITSDNSVCYYMPNKNKAFKPYTLSSQQSPVELIFPISNNMVLIGQSRMKDQFSVGGMGYAEINDVSEVWDINDTISRFAYQNVYSCHRGCTDLVVKYANIAPVSKFSSLPAPNLTYHIFETVFGQRPRKPKWKKAIAR